MPVSLDSLDLGGGFILARLFETSSAALRGHLQRARELALHAPPSQVNSDTKRASRGVPSATRHSVISEETSSIGKFLG